MAGKPEVVSTGPWICMVAVTNTVGTTDAQSSDDTVSMGEKCKEDDK